MVKSTAVQPKNKQIRLVRPTKKYREAFVEGLKAGLDDGEYKIIKLRLTYLPNAFFIIGQYILLASIILTIIVIFRKIRLNSNVQSIKK